MRRYATQVVLAVLVVGGGLLVNHVERAVVVTRPFVSAGVTGQETPLWPGTLVVHGARSGQVLATGFGDDLSTGGVWVAVDISVSGDDRPMNAQSFWLTDARGRTFDATERVMANQPGEAQPGSPIRTEILFEVPRDALGPMTFGAAATWIVHDVSAVAAVPVLVGDPEPGVMTPNPAELTGSRP